MSTHFALNSRLTAMVRFWSLQQREALSQLGTDARQKVAGGVYCEGTDIVVGNCVFAPREHAPPITVWGYASSFESDSEEEGSR